MRKIVSLIFVVLLALAAPVWAQSEATDMDALYADLARADNADWKTTEQKIWTAWSHSGSAAMDLLLVRGREAMQAENWPLAIEHLTALTDHAPDFAEGWNARATAYYQMGQFGPSLQDIQRVLALNPHHFGAISGLALILEELGHPADALKAYHEVEAIHPHSPNLKDNIERLEKEVGGTEL